MNKLMICLSLLLCVNMQKSWAQNESDIITYIDTYKNYAIEEQLRTGVPASITLAQGIHETGAGSSELATVGNNHFGIKCKANWTGETMLHDDDKKQECFRKYPNAQQSYIDHSDFLKAGSRYQFLFDIEVTDYVGWASGLKRAGYATNPTYVRKLTDLVEKYNLQQYTYQALNQKTGEIVPNIDTKNPDVIEDPNLNYKGLKGFWAKSGELMSEKANTYNIKYSKLIDYNDLDADPLPYDMFVFTEKKKKIGTVEFHLVKEGESMHIISQKEAIMLDNLYAFNNMKKGDEPLAGEQLSLQYRSYGTPKLIKKIEEIKSEPVVETNVVPVADPVVETKTDPTKTQSTETIIVATNPDILDVNKAKKVEALMGVSTEIETTIVEVKKEVATPVKEIKKVEEVAKVEEKKVEKKPLPVMPKRTYNEPGVSDSVKMLKEKFDSFVYKPFERRAKPNVKVETPKVVTPKVETPKTVAVKKTDTVKTEIKNTEHGLTREVKKVEAKKTEVAKDSIKTKVVKPAEEKKTGVEKTKTGIVRDTKKIEEEKKKKDEDAKKLAAKTKPKETAKTDKKDSKKVEVKKTTPAKKAKK